VNRTYVWIAGLLWAAGSVAAGWAVGDVALAPLLAAAWGAFLWMFVVLWRGSSLRGALLTFIVPALMIAGGGLLLGFGYRGAGYAVMFISGPAFAAVAYWVLTHWSSGAYVGGVGEGDATDDLSTNLQWQGLEERQDAFAVDMPVGRRGSRNLPVDAFFTRRWE
jgi:hypothetical protein